MKYHKFTYNLQYRTNSLFDFLYLHVQTQRKHCANLSVYCISTRFVISANPQIYNTFAPMANYANILPCYHDTHCKRGVNL